MARCKICKTNIPDGIEYCENCQDKSSIVSNESYLDSLLNSVKNTVPSVENVYKKKNKANSPDGNPGSQQLDQDNLDSISNINELNSPEVVSDSQIEDDWQDYVAYSIDLSDIEDFDKYNLDDDLGDLEPSEDLVSNEDLFGKDISEFIKEFGEDSSEANRNDSVVKPSDGLEENVDSEIIQNTISYEEPVEHFYDSSDLFEQINSDDSFMERLQSEVIDATLDVNDDMLLDKDISHLSEEDQVLANNELFEGSQLLYNMEYPDDNVPEPNSMPDPDNNVPEPNSMPDPDNNVSELYNNFSELDNTSHEPNANIPSLDNVTEFDENVSEIHDDILGFLGDIPQLEDENFDPDLNDLLDSFNTIPDDYYSNLDEKAEDKREENPIEDNTISDPSMDFDQTESDEDDFLSLLSQMSSDDPVSEDVKAINDLLQGKSVEQASNESMPSNVGEVFSDALKGISSLTDIGETEEDLLNKIPNKKDKKAKKEKKPKKEKKSKKKDSVDSEEPKKGLLQLLFGNVKKEKIQKADASEVETEAMNGETTTSPKKGKIKKSKGKSDAGGEGAGDVKKAKKGKKGAASVEGEEGAKGKAPKKEKKEKKEKKKKSKEIIQVIDDIEEDEGRINRLGATIVFLFFGLLVTLILVGTNTVSYTLSIEKATDYFDKREYTDAYNEVYGMEIKDEDFAIYNKIMTVMYVNKQLNSYNNYYSIGRYPQALDSLLKGLRRYDKYIELATMLGIDNDLKYVRKQILAELKNEFNLSQKQAMKIISYDNMETYSLAVYDVVDKNINN